MNSPVRFTFRKEERLCSKKVFQQLAKSGNSLFSYPVKLIWLQVDSWQENIAAKAAFAVSKHLFKKAADRNRIKRLMREAYRLNKHILKNPGEEVQVKKFALLLVYTARDSPNFNSITEKIRVLLQRLMNSTHTF